MKTKDFIKMLQEEDPTGEAQVLLDGGIPVCAICVPGYYDGTTSFIKNGRIILSDNKEKILVSTTCLEDFIQDIMESDGSTTLEQVRERIEFDFKFYGEEEVKWWETLIEENYNNFMDEIKNGTTGRG